MDLIRQIQLITQSSMGKLRLGWGCQMENYIQMIEAVMEKIESIHNDIFFTLFFHSYAYIGLCVDSFNW